MLFDVIEKDVRGNHLVSRFSIMMLLIENDPIECNPAYLAYRLLPIYRTRESISILSDLEI